MRPIVFLLFILAVTLFPAVVPAQDSASLAEDIYDPGQLPPTDSELRVAVGDPMPDFALPTTDGTVVRLADFLGKSNLVLTFVPAAWTPICSGQWPGYNIVQDIFESKNTALVGVTVDNVPTLHAWVTEMGGVWFTVASDFWPHGALAQELGILRSNGTSERALFLVDSQGIIRYIDVHDINTRPDLGLLLQALDEIEAP